MAQPRRSDPHKYVVVGYSTNRHLLVDIDRSDLRRADWLAKHIQQTFPTGDCLLMQSHEHDDTHTYLSGLVPVHLRPGNYHLVYDAWLPWEKIMEICEYLEALGLVEKDYAEVRRWRGDLTLRISYRYDEGVDIIPVPKPVRYYRADYHYTGFGIYLYLKTLYAFLQSERLI